jgi:purine-nucleoside phosphorylase
MVFKGGDPVRSKTVIDKVIEQGNSCNHLRTLISYEV